MKITMEAEVGDVRGGLHGAWRIWAGGSALWWWDMANGRPSDYLTPTKAHLPIEGGLTPVRRP